MQILIVVVACLMLGIVISLCIKTILEASEEGEYFAVAIFIMLAILIGLVGGVVLYGLVIDWKDFLPFTEQLF